MLNKVIRLTFQSVDETLVCDHSNESYIMSCTLMWYCLLYILNKVIRLTFQSVDETLVCDHLNESYCKGCTLMWYCLLC